MGGVEGWLTQRRKFGFGDDKRVMDDLRARARFALYCEIGSDQERDGAYSERNQSEYQWLCWFPSEYPTLQEG